MTFVRGAHVLRTRAWATPGTVPATTAAATKATTARCGGRTIALGALVWTVLLGMVVLPALGGGAALDRGLALGDRRGTHVCDLRARVGADRQLDACGVDELHHLGLGDLVDLLLADRAVGGMHRRHVDVAVLAPEREVGVRVDDQRGRGGTAVRRRRRAVVGDRDRRAPQERRVPADVVEALLEQLPYALALVEPGAQQVTEAAVVDLDRSRLGADAGSDLPPVAAAHGHRDLAVRSRLTGLQIGDQLAPSVGADPALVPEAVVRMRVLVGRKRGLDHRVLHLAGRHRVGGRIVGPRGTGQRGGRHEQCDAEGRDEDGGAGRHVCLNWRAPRVSRTKVAELVGPTPE